MKLEDRIQALKRSSKYRKDYKKYDTFREKNKITDTYLNDYLAPIFHVSPEGQKLCKKYKIPYPFNPDDHIEVFPGSQILSLEKGVQIPAVLPIPLRKTETEHIFGLKDGQYLPAYVDMNETEDAIIRAIQELYKFYSPQVKKGKRPKTTKIPHWEIYYEVKVNNKNLLQITRERFKIKKDPAYNPAYNSVTMKYYRQVERAYKKAEKLLKEFEG